MNPFRLLRWGEIPYQEALDRQKVLVDELLAGRHEQALILTEHPHVYTLGRATPAEEILHLPIHGENVPLCPTDRGGKATYHGPGQTIAYVVRDMRRSVMAVRQHVTLLEESIIATLADLGVSARVNPHAPGVWVNDAKIAALGVRIRQGVSYHGVAINRQPDLSYFTGIIPCGLAHGQVTSLAALGVLIDRPSLENLYVQHFSKFFGPVV